MSVIKGHPHKYEKPGLGAIFQREQQDGKWEYGHISGLRVQTVKDAEGNERIAGWQAHLTTGRVDFRDVIRHDGSYTSTEDWHPVPADVEPFVRKEMLEAIERRYEEFLARLEKVEAAVAGAAPAPAPQKPERPSRTAAVG